MPQPASIVVRNLGTQDYQPVYKAMSRFSAGRDKHSSDEFWLVEHPPVFTQGRNSNPAHLLTPGEIPVVDIDRGGQVTYHGPGQLVLYTLIDLPRAKLGVRDLVSALEHSVIALLAEQNIEAAARPDAPGVYVEGAKIAALGLRVKRGRSYHGLSLNVDMDLEPFSRINPCGHKGMEVTMLRELGVQASSAEIADRLCDLLAADLGYNARQFCEKSPL